MCVIEDLYNKCRVWKCNEDAGPTEGLNMSSVQGVRLHPHPVARHALRVRSRPRALRQGVRPAGTLRTHR